MKRHGMDSPFFFPSPAAVFFVTVRTSSLPLQSGAGVPPCSPQSCHRTVPDVPETRPGLPSNKVEEEKVGGGVALSGGPVSIRATARLPICTESCS